jgi:hypothetical protein
VKDGVSPVESNEVSEMKKECCFWIRLIIVMMVPAAVSAQNNPIRFSDIHPDLDSAVSRLSTNINMFEEILRKMDESARSNQNYSEQKNVFLSSQLAITTITAILEYNRDLLVLFGDLKESNRKKFYAVRIESLETSIRQISNMHKQIQINYTILPPGFFEQRLVNAERMLIMSSLESLETCVELLKSVHQK